MGYSVQDVLVFIPENSPYWNNAGRDADYVPGPIAVEFRGHHT